MPVANVPWPSHQIGVKHGSLVSRLAVCMPSFFYLLGRIPKTTVLLSQEDEPLLSNSKSCNVWCDSSKVIVQDEHEHLGDRVVCEANQLGK